MARRSRIWVAACVAALIAAALVAAPMAMAATETKKKTTAAKPKTNPLDSKTSGGAAKSTDATKSGAEAAAKPAPAKKSILSAENKDHFFKIGPKSAGAVCLTFDDGPDPKLTPTVLEELKKHNIKATFFMIGSCVKTYPKIAKMVADAGFEIGNHTWTHPHLPKMTREQIHQELEKTTKAIQEATGVTPKLFRPPYGDFNDEVVTVAREMGMDTVHWEIDAQDWVKKQTPVIIRDTILKRSRPGTIILLHDSQSRTVTAVPEILDGFVKENMKVMNAGEMVATMRDLRKATASAAPVK